MLKLLIISVCLQSSVSLEVVCVISKMIIPLSTHFVISFLAMLLMSVKTTWACNGGGEHDLYRVVRKTDVGGKNLVVATEETAKLYCQTNVPWKKCFWKPPRNGVREVSSSP